jgi:hypothetical protein
MDDMTISEQALATDVRAQRMSCSPSIEQFAIRQNATPLPASTAFQGFSLSDAFRPEMLRAV